MKAKVSHPWQVTTGEARRIQERLRSRLILKPPANFFPRLVAGADASYQENPSQVVAAIVVMRLPGLELVEERVASCPTRFPYVPGLLTFREGPAILKALKKVKSPIDVLLLDGQGIAHPRGLGLAAHIGLLLDIPTVGCAKSRLVGTTSLPLEGKGASSPIIFNEKLVGATLRTRAGVKPIFVSPGHRMDLETAIHLVMACLTRYRIPEPLRRAHMLVNEAVR